MSRPSAFDGYLGAVLGAVSLAVPGCDDPLKLDWSCHRVSVDEASIELEKRWGLDLDEVLAEPIMHLKERLKGPEQPSEFTALLDRMTADQSKLGA